MNRTYLIICYIGILTLFGIVHASNILVEFSEGFRFSDDSALQEILKKHSIQSIKKWIPFATPKDKTDKINFYNVYRLKTPLETETELNDIISSLSSIPGLIRAGIELEHKLHYIPNDSSYSSQWYLDQIHFNDALDLWNIPSGIIPDPENVLLVTVDTGIDWTHPDLTPHIWQNLNEDADGDGRTIECDGNLFNGECFGDWILDPDDFDNIDGDDWDDNPNSFIDDLIGWDMVGYSGAAGDPNPMPLQDVSNQSDWNHGTHVSGVMAAVTDNIIGIASSSYNGKVMMVKIARDDSGQDEVILNDGYLGILYAAKTGYFAGLTTIINVSWGAPSTSEFEEELIQLVWEEYNGIIVSSAGNGMYGNENFGPSFPSAFDYVLSAAPLGQDDVWNHWANYHSSVSLSAPGEAILSTIINNGYASGTGSSLAAPIVAGSLGLLAAYRPDYNKDHLIGMITGTADKSIYDTNSESYLVGNLGTGRLDIYSALLTPLFPIITAEIESIDLINDVNGMLNVGDSFNISFRLSNDIDWGLAENIQIQFSATHPEIIVDHSTNNIDSIPAGEFRITEIEDVFVHVPENLPIGEYDFKLSLISNQGTEISAYEQVYNYHLNFMPAILYGDIDGNWEVDIKDLLITREIIIGNLPENGFPMHLVNLNFDNYVNVIDIALLLSLIVQQGY